MCACGHTLLLLFYSEWSLSSKQHLLGIFHCPYPHCLFPFPSPSVSVSVSFSPALLMSPTCIRVTVARGPDLNTLSLPLSPSFHLEAYACTWFGSGRYPPCPEYLPSQWPPPCGCPVLSWGVWSSLGVGWGMERCLIRRTIPGTCSDGRLCSGITNREIKEMLHSHSGKIKCACTSHF